MENIKMQFNINWIPPTYRGSNHGEHANEIYKGNLVDLEEK